MEEETTDEGTQFKFYCERADRASLMEGTLQFWKRETCPGQETLEEATESGSAFSLSLLLSLALLWLPVWVSQLWSPSGKNQQVVGGGSLGVFLGRVVFGGRRAEGS